MTTIHSDIIVSTSVDKVWNMLTDLELLDKYDPTVKKSTLVSTEKTGIGAKRKIVMLDGKNWFDEKVTVFRPNEALTYELTDCSFPVHQLKHSYSFEKIGDQTKVKQVMEYTIKFGLVGKLLDSLMINKQFKTGIKKFLGGLKDYAEKR